VGICATSFGAGQTHASGAGARLQASTVDLFVIRDLEEKYFGQQVRQ
jgi:hypothetical protein